MNKLKSHKYLAPFFLTLVGLFFLPSPTRHVRHIQISKILAIQTTKLEPPRVAFDLISMGSSAADDFAKYANINLNDWLETKTAQTRTEYKNHWVQLNTMTISHGPTLEEKVGPDVYASLTTEQKNRLQQADAESDILSQDWRPPSFQVLAQEKIDSVNKEIESAQKSQETRVIVQGLSQDKKWQGRESIQTQGVAVRKNAGHKASGAVVASNGILLGNREVRVSHYYRGSKSSVQLFDRKTGQFETSLQDLSGTLMAELVDEEGHVVASGQQRISENMTSDQLAKLKINLNVLNQLSGTTYNFAKLSDRLNVENIQATQSVKSDLLLASMDQNISSDDLGGFQFKGVTPGSTSFVRTHSAGFYSGLHITKSGHKNKLPLFPNNLVKAVLNISKDRQLYSSSPENGSVVWGQVLLDGKPLSGVKVEVLSNEDFKPIYLNGWLPDPNLDSTSENGYFIFVNLPQGMHSLIATRGGQQYSHINVEVDEESISSAVLEHTLKTDISELRSYDAFSGTPVATHLELQSLPEGISIEGFSEIRLPALDRQSILTSQATQADYIPVQMMYSDSDAEINVPHVRYSWIQAVQAQQKISSSNQGGLIIGFVQEDGFEAFLPHEQNFPRENIVYFDSTGQVINHGVAGGGFIIFNVPLGSQSVTIMYEKSEQVHSQIIPVDSGYVSTLIFHF